MLDHESNYFYGIEEENSVVHSKKQIEKETDEEMVKLLRDELHKKIEEETDLDKLIEFCEAIFGLEEETKEKGRY